jgi:hypothetical protein
LFLINCLQEVADGADAYLDAPLTRAGLGHRGDRGRALRHRRDPQDLAGATCASSGWLGAFAGDLPLGVGSVEPRTGARTLDRVVEVGRRLTDQLGADLLVT